MILFPNQFSRYRILNGGALRRSLISVLCFTKARKSKQSIPRIGIHPHTLLIRSDAIPPKWVGRSWRSGKVSDCKTVEVHVPLRRINYFYFIIKTKRGVYFLHLILG